MSLNVSVSGAGPRMVLLHGWALNSRVWSTLAPALAERFTVVSVDLPGHGDSSWPPQFHDIDSLADSLEATVFDDAAEHRGTREPCIVVGWSLGGMAALALAARRARDIRQLVLVAATPKFVRDETWAHGAEGSVVDGFATRMLTDARSTVREFLALQVQGDERAQATLRVLRNEVTAGGDAQLAALTSGLDVLRTTDLRDRLSKVSVPSLVISGERDRLTMPAAGEALAELLPDGRHYLVRRAAHAPFISHADEFGRVLRDFLEPANHTVQEAAH